MSLKNRLMAIILSAELALFSSFGCHKQEEQEPQRTEQRVSSNLTCTENVIESSPKFSSDGNSIFYVSMPQDNKRKEDICIMKADGTNKKSLVSIISKDGYGAIKSITLSPDGREIAFISDYESYSKGDDFVDPFVDSTGNEIYLVNVDGSNRRRLTNDRMTKIKPVFSSDGKQIAYIARRMDVDTYARYESSIHVMDRNGSNNKQVVNTKLIISDFKLSPNDSQIAFVENDVSPGYYTHEGKISVINSDGTNKRELKNSNLKQEDFNPVFLGKNKLLYIYDRDSGSGRNIRDIHIADLEKLTDEPGIVVKDVNWIENMVLSPDRKQVAYCALDGGEQWIYVTNVDGSNRRRLENILPKGMNAGIKDLVFSPDGKSIAYSCGDISLIKVN